jgi:hypothetical protein
VSDRQRLRFLAQLGGALHMRYLVSRDRRDLSNAIDRLEEAHRLANRHSGQDMGVADGTSILFQLGQCYAQRLDANRRDRRRAVAAGLGALRERAESVLVQTGAERALTKAMSATDEAAEVARWCAACNDVEAAVQALELGRGMVLHAATVEAGVPTLLREGGQAELAARWEQEAARTEAPWDLTSPPDTVVGAPIPSELRRQVLTAIADTDISTRLFSPPSPSDIAAALRTAGATALVYLVAGETHAGMAVLVDATGAVHGHPLPRLRPMPGGPIDVFQRSQRDLLTAADDAARERWSTALRNLCGWAWSEAMAPVLQQLIRVRPAQRARVVLVPVGTLGAVPWHAACRPVRGGLRYAGEEAIISYAASARQFVDAVRRRHPSWDSAPTLVRVRDSGLYWDAKEMAEIRAHCYPGCTYLGAAADDPGPVLPTDIAALLPGASVLHLGCHGHYAPTPVDSSLLLDNGGQLYVRDVLRHARDRPADAPGGLVVLATCVSDLTDNAHDEALTLAAAFLAGGGVGVVGARWPVDDLPTALFMIMFHHYLNFGYPSPATALRATQAWMLKPDRTLPAGIDPRLAGPMRRADLAAVENWAAFTYQGH